MRREEEEWCDLAVVAAERTDFWYPLAIEQIRQFRRDITTEPVPVALPTGDVEAAVDALIENVLSHTADGVRLEVSVEVVDEEEVLCIEDAGGGFDNGSAVERGISSGASTGLGLDIVRRTVEDAGGTLALGESRSLGGAGIAIRLPLSSGS